MNFRNMLNSIFGTNKQVPQQMNIERFELLNNYENVFSIYQNSGYDDATIRTCIDLIARHAAKFKPKHIKRTDAGTENLNSYMIKLLGERPNEFMSGFDFLYKTISQLYDNNNAFIYIKRSYNGQIQGFYPLDYADIQLVRVNSEPYLKFYFMSAGVITVPYTNIIHLRRFYNKHEFFGADNQSTLKDTLKILNIVKQALENAVKNSVKLRGLLKFSSALRPEEIEEHTQKFTDSFLKTSKSAGIAAVDNRSEFQQLTSEVKTVDVGQMDFIRQEVYRYFSISEKILTSSYTEQEYLAFFESVLEPIALQLSQEFTKKVFTDRERAFGNEIVFEASRLQHANLKTKITMASSLMQMGILTPNEIREVFGYAGVEDGDERLISLNFVKAKLQDQYQTGEDNSHDSKNNEQ